MKRLRSLRTSPPFSLIGEQKKKRKREKRCGYRSGSSSRGRNTGALQARSPGGREVNMYKCNRSDQTNKFDRSIRKVDVYKCTID